MDAGVADRTVLLLLFNTTRTLSGPPSTHVASRSTQQRARAHDLRGGPQSHGRRHGQHNLLDTFSR